MEVVVLRLGHRIARDKRISTHCALVARAFGAREIIFSGEKEEAIITTVNSISKKWGGKFSARYEAAWKKALREFKGIKVHLTMYGIPFEKTIQPIKRVVYLEKTKLMVVVGAEKVPGEVYGLCDYNLSVTSQPHSEVGALAVFLYELTRGSKINYPGAEIKIVPQKSGKKVVATRAS